MFAEPINDPASCGHWLINLNDNKDPSLLIVISLDLNLKNQTI